MLNIRCEAFPYGKRRHIFYCSSIIFQVFVCAFSKFHFIMIDWIMNIVWFCPRSLSFAHAWGSIFWSGRIHFMPGRFCSRSQDLLGCRKYGGCHSIRQILFGGPAHVWKPSGFNLLCLRRLIFVWSSGIGGFLWPVVGPQQIYESLRQDCSRCFAFWIGRIVLVVSREISLRDKLYFFEIPCWFSGTGHINTFSGCFARIANFCVRVDSWFSSRGWWSASQRL